MAQHQHTPPLFSLEEAVTVLLCLIDDAYRLLNPNWRSYEPLKKLSDSEVLTLALLQQLRAMESERSFLRDAGRFFSHLFPGVVGLHPSSLHRRVRKLKLRSYLEPLRRAVVTDLLGDPETLIIDSTLLAVLHPRQVAQSAGLLGDGTVRRLFGDLAYRSGTLAQALAVRNVLLAAERADRRPAIRQQVEVCFAALKGVLGMDGTLAKRLVGLATRIAAKVAAYTFGCYVNRFLGCPQGRIKELWA
jgi:hypothetical protein